MYKNILVTTSQKGVWYAEVLATADLTSKTLQNLKNCRMAIYWGTDKGLQQLCHTGPTPTSRISAPADIEVLHDVTAIFSITDEAAIAWRTKQ